MAKTRNTSPSRRTPPRRRELLRVTDDDDDDGIRVYVDDMWCFAAACLLMTRGQLAKPEEPERAGRDWCQFARDEAKPAELKAAIKEVKKMTPEQRGDFLRPLLGDYDA